MNQQDSFGLLGSVLEGRYRLESLVGEGGFGVVYRGYHLVFEHPVAVKCLKTPAHFNSDARATFVARFREEGKLLSRLSESPGIVRVFDYGVIHSPLRGETPYLVLEWLEGQTLEENLRKRFAQGYPPCSVEEAFSLLEPAIEALSFAHSLKIAHRDIKPANLFLTQTPRGITMKILDFGIAKAMQEGETATQVGTGTSSGFHAFSPLYGAPEQFFSRRYGASGPWTDVHALGLVMVEMITGKPALTGTDPAELLESSTREWRPTPRNMGIIVTDAVEWVFQKALARSSSDRFQDAKQLLEALRYAIQTTSGSTAAASAINYNAGPYPSGTQQAGYSVAYVQNPAAYSAMGYPPGTQVAQPPANAFSAVGTPLPGHSPLAPQAQLSAQSLAQGGPQQSLPNAQSARIITPYPGQMPATPHGPTHLAPALQGVSPPEKPPPTVRDPAPKKNRIWPFLVLGAIPLVAISFTALYGASVLLSDPSSPDPSGSAPGPGNPGQKMTNGVLLARNVVHGQDYYPVQPLSAEQAKGKWHNRVTIANEKVIKIEAIRPSGLVSETLDIKRQPDGALSINKIDSHNVTLSITTHRENLISTVARSGVISERGCAQLKQTYSAEGDVIEETCLGPTGFAVIDESGCAIRRYTWSADHIKQSSACFTEDPKPQLDSDGVHLEKYQYNAEGKLEDESFFDIQGSPTPRVADGCFRVHLLYDTAGNRVALQCLDASGAPRAFQGQTSTQAKFEYDANGCSTRTLFLDGTGKPATRGSLHSYSTRRDNHCAVTHSELRGLKGELIRDNDWGLPLVDYSYDAQGLLLSRSCYGVDSRPMSCGGATTPVGVTIRYTYDEKGRVTSEKGFAQDGTPTKQSHSYPHETKTAYGNDGRKAMEAFFDERSTPTTALGGVAIMSFRYDALGGLVSEIFYGLDRKPVESAVGCHEIKRSFDEKHRLALIECRNTAGELRQHLGMIHAGVEWPAGAARMAVERGEYIANMYFNAKGAVVKRVECKKLDTPCYR